MLAKLSALLLALPFVSALTILPLTGATPGSTVNIQWTATTQDPTYFSIELQNPAFNDIYAIANNVQTSLGQITITLPQVLPGTDFNLVAISTNNVNQVLSTSGTFSIGTASSASAASSTAASTTASASSISSQTAATFSPTTTIPISAASSAVISSASSSTGSAASSTPSSFNSNGAAAFKMPGMVPAAGLLLSAIAGAAMVF